MFLATGEHCCPMHKTRNALEQWFLNLSTCQNHPGDLLKHRFLGCHLQWFEFNKDGEAKI